MAFIIYETEGKTHRTELVQEATSIGRSVRATIQIRNDSKLSGVHCTIYRRQNGYALKDHESRNGTSLNGRRIGEGEYMLGDGDKITAGGSTLKFRGKANPSTGAGGKLFSKILGVFKHD